MANLPQNSNVQSSTATTTTGSTLPSYRVIYDQDYPPQYQSLIAQLSVPINYGFLALYSLLNKGLTFTNNISSTVQTFPATVDKNGNPTSPISFAKTTTGSITGLLVVKVINPTTPTIYPTGGVFVSYSETATAINVLNITGLPPSNSFNITVVTIQ